MLICTYLVARAVIYFLSRCPRGSQLFLMAAHLLPHSKALWGQFGRGRQQTGTREAFVPTPAGTIGLEEIQDSEGEERRGWGPANTAWEEEN